MISARTKTQVQRLVGSEDSIETNRRTDGRQRLLYLPDNVVDKMANVDDRQERSVVRVCSLDNEP